MIVCFMLIFLLLWVAGGDLPVLRHDLGGSAAHVVVGTGYGETGSHLAEQHGAVLGVIGDIPDTRAGLDAGLVAVVIVDGRECAFLVLDGGVLALSISASTSFSARTTLRSDMRNCCASSRAQHSLTNMLRCRHCIESAPLAG